MDGKTGQITIKKLIGEQTVILVQFWPVFLCRSMHVSCKTEPEIKAKKTVIPFGAVQVLIFRDSFTHALHKIDKSGHFTRKELVK